MFDSTWKDDMVVTYWRFEEIVPADCYALLFFYFKNRLSAAETGLRLRPEKFSLAAE